MTTVAERPNLRVLGPDDLEKLRRLEVAKSDCSGAELVDLWLAGDHELTDAEFLSILPRLPPLFYERKRTAIAAKLGVRVGALDEVRHPAANGKTVEGQGRAVVFHEDAPWPESVDGAQLLSDLAAVFSRHVVLPGGAADAAALWVAFAHVFDLFDIAPLLAVTSPTKRCGKSTMLDVAGELVPRALRTSGISPAALFRSLQKWKPTLLVDEGDLVLKDNEPLRLLLNAGHSRAAAYIVRCEGETLEPALFSTWGCKIVGAIGRLPDTLADRSIDIRLQRKRPDEVTARVDRRARETLGQLRRQLIRWAKDAAPMLAGIAERADDAALPSWLGDRQRDNWRPLIAIARAADRIGDTTWLGRALAAIDVVERGDEDDADAATLLLIDLRDMFAACTDERLRTEIILSHLHDLPERPWSEWGRTGRPMTAHALAAQLRRYGVKPKAWGGGVRGYERAALDPVWARYLPRSSPLQGGGDRVQYATPRDEGASNQAKPAAGGAQNRGNGHAEPLRERVADSDSESTPDLPTGAGPADVGPIGPEGDVANPDRNRHAEPQRPRPAESGRNGGLEHGKPSIPGSPGVLATDPLRIAVCTGGPGGGGPGGPDGAQIPVVDKEEDDDGLY